MCGSVCVRRDCERERERGVVSVCVGCVRVRRECECGCVGWCESLSVCV